jgi:molybdate transport system permease protein
VNWTAIWVTFKLASLTALILLVIGLPIAYWLSFSRWRLKFLVESVVALPLVLPPTVLGFYILVSIGPHSPFGRLYSSLVGHPLPFTFSPLRPPSIRWIAGSWTRPGLWAYRSLGRS